MDVPLRYTDWSSPDAEAKPRERPGLVLPALELRFPHVCAEITRLWNSPEIEPYLQSLVVDQRFDRQGFPPEAFEELLFLSDLAWVLHHGDTTLLVAHPEAHDLGVPTELAEYAPEDDPFTLAWTPTRH